MARTIGAKDKQKRKRRTIIATATTLGVGAALLSKRKLKKTAKIKKTSPSVKVIVRSGKPTKVLGSKKSKTVRVRQKNRIQEYKNMYNTYTPIVKKVLKGSYNLGKYTERYKNIAKLI